MTVTVLFFAYLRDYTGGAPQVELDVPEGATPRSIWSLLAKEWPALEDQLLRLPIVVDGKVVDLPNSDHCCGSAGIYNLTQPDMAARLLEKKMDSVEAVNPTVVAVGNPGCLLQTQIGQRARGIAAPMRHPVEILARAYPRAGVEL